VKLLVEAVRAAERNLNGCCGVSKAAAPPAAQWQRLGELTFGSRRAVGQRTRTLEDSEGWDWERETM
jgi:hypothetical protein